MHNVRFIKVFERAETFFPKYCFAISACRQNFALLHLFSFFLTFIESRFVCQTVLVYSFFLYFACFRYCLPPRILVFCTGYSLYPPFLPVLFALVCLSPSLLMTLLSVTDLAAVTCSHVSVPYFSKPGRESGG